MSSSSLIFANVILGTTPEPVPLSGVILKASHNNHHTVVLYEPFLLMWQYAFFNRKYSWILYYWSFNCEILNTLIVPPPLASELGTHYPKLVLLIMTMTNKIMSENCSITLSLADPKNHPAKSSTQNPILSFGLI